MGAASEDEAGQQCSPTSPSRAAEVRDVQQGVVQGTKLVCSDESSVIRNFTVTVVPL